MKKLQMKDKHNEKPPALRRHQSQSHLQAIPTVFLIFQISGEMPAEAIPHYDWLPKSCNL